MKKIKENPQILFIVFIIIAILYAVFLDGCKSNQYLRGYAQAHRDCHSNVKSELRELKKLQNGFQNRDLELDLIQKSSENDE